MRFREQCTGDGLHQGVVQRGTKRPGGPVPARRPGQKRRWPTGGAIVAPTGEAAAPVLRLRCWIPGAVAAPAAPRQPGAASGTARFVVRPSLPRAPRTSEATQAESSGEAHAWDTSFDASDRSDPHHASHLISKWSPKTMTLFVKRSTKYAAQGTIAEVWGRKQSTAPAGRGTHCLDVHFINTLPVLVASRHSRESGKSRRRALWGLDARLRGHDVLLAPDLRNGHLVARRSAGRSKVHCLSHCSLTPEIIKW